MNEILNKFLLAGEINLCLKCMKDNLDLYIVPVDPLQKAQKEYRNSKNQSIDNIFIKMNQIKFEQILCLRYSHFVLPLPEVSLSKNLQTIEATPHSYPSYFGFLALLNALSIFYMLYRNILSETVIAAKPLKFKNFNISKTEIPERLHKPIIRKFEKRKLY